MRKLGRTLPFLVTSLALILSGCGADATAPTDLDADYAKVGTYSPMPEVAYIGGFFGPEISVVSLPTMTIVGQVNTGLVAPQQLAISNAGKIAYVTHEQPSGVSKVDLETGAVLATLPLDEGSGPFDLRLTPNGARLFVSLFWGHQVAAIDAGSMELLALIPLTDETDYVNGVFMAPGGREVWVASQGSGRVHIIDTQSLAVTGVVETGVSINEVGLTSKLAFATASGSGQVFAIDRKTLEIVTSIEVGRPRGIAVPAHGREVYVTGGGVTVIIDVKTLAVVHSWDIPGRRIVANTNGRMALTTGREIKLYDMANRTFLTSLLPSHGVWDADITMAPKSSH